jgi:hypothetical protein
VGLNVRGGFPGGQELLTGPRKCHRSLDESRLLGEIGDLHVAAATVNFVPVGDRGFDRLAAGKCQQSEAHEEGGRPQHVVRIGRVPRSRSRLWSRYVLRLPDFDPADRIGEFWGQPELGASGSC